MIHGRKRVAHLQDIPLEGPSGQTIRRPRERQTVLWVGSAVIVLAGAGLLALLSWSPETLASVVRAFSGQ